MLNAIVKNMTEEDMPNEDMKLVCDAIGLEATIKLMDSLAGCQLNIPKGWGRVAALRYIKGNMNLSAKKLAVHTDLSSGHVYQIMKEIRADNFEKLLSETEKNNL